MDVLGIQITANTSYAYIFFFFWMQRHKSVPYGVAIQIRLPPQGHINTKSHETLIKRIYPNKSNSHV